MKSILLTYILVVFLSLVLLDGSIVFGIRNLAGWLVVDQNPVQTNAIVVLGGGGGSRLRHAVKLYDLKDSDLLILVGEEAGDWQNILGRHCSECDFNHRRHVILNGSQNTITDAELVLDFLKVHPFKSFVVVTDPYHTRRAAITFEQVFSNSDIQVTVVSSGDYGKYLSPEDYWWLDIATLKTVWLELGKCFVVLCTQYFPGFDTA